MLRETASLPMAHASAAASLGGLAATRRGLCFQTGLLPGTSRVAGMLPLCNAHRPGGGVGGRGLGRRRMVLAMAMIDPVARSAKTFLHHGADMMHYFLVKPAPPRPPYS